MASRMRLGSRDRKLTVWVSLENSRHSWLLSPHFRRSYGGGGGAQGPGRVQCQAVGVAATSWEGISGIIPATINLCAGLMIENASTKMQGKSHIENGTRSNRELRNQRRDVCPVCPVPFGGPTDAPGAVGRPGRRRGRWRAASAASRSLPGFFLRPRGGGSGVPPPPGGGGSP